MQLAACLAGGHPWLGFDVPKPKRVLYIAGEGVESEWQEKMRPLAELFPYPEDNLIFGFMPPEPLDSPNGKRDFFEVGSKVKPDLTILDPLYMLMGGSAKDDDRSRVFVHMVNLYQVLTGSAVLVMHHEHRARRDQKGHIINEGDDAYFGSYVWRNWARTPLTLKVASGGQHRVLGCGMANRALALADMPDGELPLLYIPNPMHYIVKDDSTVTASEYAISQVFTSLMTVPELERATGLGHATVFRVVTKWLEEGKVLKLEEHNAIMYERVSSPPE